MEAGEEKMQKLDLFKAREVIEKELGYKVSDSQFRKFVEFFVENFTASTSYFIKLYLFCMENFAQAEAKPKPRRILRKCREKGLHIVELTGKCRVAAEYYGMPTGGIGFFRRVAEVEGEGRTGTAVQSQYYRYYKTFADFDCRGATAANLANQIDRNDSTYAGIFNVFEVNAFGKNETTTLPVRCVWTASRTKSELG